MSRAAALALLLGGAASAQDSAVGPQYRAYTLDPGERRVISVPSLERVTGSSGSCIEEELSEFESVVLVARCAGVRTTLAWLKDGARMHFLACAEDAGRDAALVRRRKQLQAALKDSKGVTACVRARRLEVLGWVLSDAERAKVAAAAKRHGADDKVEKVGEGG